MSEKTSVVSIASRRFEVGHSYTTEQIKKILGSNGKYQQLVVASLNGVLCIRFQPIDNPAWETKGELWIQDGERRIPDAERWAEARTPVPIFCGHKGVNSWKFIGTATASITYSGPNAAKYTGKKNVALVLKMKLTEARRNSKPVVIRRKAA